MKSAVYFAKADTTDPIKRSTALTRLLTKAAPFTQLHKDEYVPVKLTIGDTDCVYHVSPALVKEVIAAIKKKGARPFLFDTSVIYKGDRQVAVDHLNLAQRKGFGHAEVGAPFIIADGVFGSDGKEHRLRSKDIGRIKTPSFVGMTDSLVTISHATGHIVSRYAGAIKNIAMGLACRPTKQVQHSSLKPGIITSACVGCGKCVAICPANAITLRKGKSVIDQTACVGCGECLCACTFNAITLNWKEDPQVFCRRMVDVASFILPHFTNTFFITVALDVTKECDCISTKGEKMIADNIGILASTDVLALDQATVDLMVEHRKGDGFIKDRDIYNGMLDYAETKGLGSRAYDLVTA